MIFCDDLHFIFFLPEFHIVVCDVQAVHVEDGGMVSQLFWPNALISTKLYLRLLELS